MPSFLPMLISVIIPTHNRAAFLPQAIESVLAQDATTEIIVVDDGSTDNTEQVVGRWDSSQVRFLQQGNRGVSAARNNGFAHSSGEFVLFLDSDDYLLPCALITLQKYLVENPDIGVVHSDGYVVNSSGQPTGELNYYRKTPFQDDLAYFIGELSVIGIHSALSRRNALELLPQPFNVTSGAEDLELWLDLKERNVRFAYLPEHTCCYRIHTDNKSVRKSQARIASKVGWASRHWFNALPEEARYRFFLNLVGGEASGTPELQAPLLAHPSFLCLPRHLQADIFCQIGVQALGCAEARNWSQHCLKTALRLAPSSIRYQVIFMVAQLPASHQKSLVGVWRRVRGTASVSPIDPVSQAQKDSACTT